MSTDAKADAKRKQTFEPCQWFALCENLATLHQPHPILGDVPICQRCKDKYDKFSD